MYNLNKVINISNKFKPIRELLRLSQVEIARKCDVDQRAISDLESGKRGFIPTEYILFLHNEGIDLNWLFSDDFDIKNAKREKLVKPVKVYTEDVNQYISELHNRIKDKDFIIELLKKDIEDNNYLESLDILKEKIKQLSNLESPKEAKKQKEKTH